MLLLFAYYHCHHYLYVLLLLAVLILTQTATATTITSTTTTIIIVMIIIIIIISSTLYYYYYHDISMLLLSTFLSCSLFDSFTLLPHSCLEAVRAIIFGGLSRGLFLLLASSSLATSKRVWTLLWVAYFCCSAAWLRSSDYAGLSWPQAPPRWILCLCLNLIDLLALMTSVSFC